MLEMLGDVGDIGDLGDGTRSLEECPFCIAGSFSGHQEEYTEATARKIPGMTDMRRFLYWVRNITRRKSICCSRFCVTCPFYEKCSDETEGNVGAQNIEHR